MRNNSAEMKNHCMATKIRSAVGRNHGPALKIHSAAMKIHCTAMRNHSAVAREQGAGMKNHSEPMKNHDAATKIHAWQRRFTAGMAVLTEVRVRVMIILKDKRARARARKSGIPNHQRTFKSAASARAGKFVRAKPQKRIKSLQVFVVRPRPIIARIPIGSPHDGETYCSLDFAIPNLNAILDRRICDCHPLDLSLRRQENCGAV